MLYCFEQKDYRHYAVIDTFDGVVYYYKTDELISLYKKGIKFEGLGYSRDKSRTAVKIELKTNMGFYDNLPDWQKLVVISKPELKFRVSIEDFIRYFNCRLKTLQNLAKIDYFVHSDLYDKYGEGVTLDNYYETKISVRYNQAGIWSVMLVHRKHIISEIDYDTYHPSSKRDFNLRNIVTLYKMLITGRADEWLLNPQVV